MSDEFSQVLSSTALEKNKTSRMACLSNSSVRRVFRSLLLACGVALLAACVGTGPYPGVPILGAKLPPPYKGPVAASQVAYRIDENRFFEVVPREGAACYRAGIFYTDTTLGIHTLVMGLNQLGGVDLVIDAANTDYLVGPTIEGGGSCYNCGGSWLPYSTDAGRTWKLGGGGPSSPSNPLTLSGTKVHVFSSLGVKNVVSTVDLTKDKIVMKDWKDEVGGVPPNPRIAPIDTKFRCIPNGKE
ncbi:hypothetical protein H7F36_14360 [Variovorax sp. PAMC28562]|uniref:T6SS immunity protein Tli3 family protein n=1 Tax=Variovorax sp. PAMC28562 TaxID=2762323 RepID=UPI00164D098D|nr:hypothetical protein [Variovorax sp. PAMC28562]QNK72400.1 hypothetical protein H7F36_14360 [Variovorax sp. PAMC28562]